MDARGAEARRMTRAPWLLAFVAVAKCITCDFSGSAACLGQPAPMHGPLHDFDTYRLGIEYIVGEQSLKKRIGIYTGKC